MMFNKMFVASILDVSGQAPSVAIPSCGAKTGVESLAFMGVQLSGNKLPRTGGDAVRDVPLPT